MRLYKAWFNECILHLERNWQGAIAIILLIAVCIIQEQEMLTALGRELGCRIFSLDAVIMLTSPPSMMLPMPQILIGLLAVIIVYLISKDDEGYSYITRSTTVKRWNRRVFIGIIISLLMATLYCAMVGAMSCERYGFAGLTPQQSDLFSHLTNLDMQRTPTFVEVGFTAWFDSLSMVLVEVAAFLFLSKVLQSKITAIAIVATIANISLGYIRISPIIKSGYFVFTASNHFLYPSLMICAILLFTAIRILAQCPLQNRKDFL